MTDKERRLARRLGDAIRANRKRQRLSQAELAEALSISVDFAGMLERGQRLPALPLLLRIAQLFGISTDILLGGDDEGPYAEAAALLRGVPAEQLPTVVAMLRGLLIEARREAPQRGKRILHN